SSRTSPLSLHDALPISGAAHLRALHLHDHSATAHDGRAPRTRAGDASARGTRWSGARIATLPQLRRADRFTIRAVPALQNAVQRSEEHTSELQSPYDLV